MPEFDEPTAKAMSLPSAKRAELAELLIQSLEEQDDPEIKSAWVKEIQRRDQEIRSGEKVTRPAEQVLKHARGQLQSSFLTSADREPKAGVCGSSASPEPPGR